MERNPVDYVKRLYGIDDNEILVRQTKELVSSAEINHGRLGLHHIEDIADQKEWKDDDLLITVGMLSFGGYFKQRFVREENGIEIPVSNYEVGKMMREKDTEKMRETLFFFEATWPRPCKGPISPGM